MSVETAKEYFRRSDDPDAGHHMEHYHVDGSVVVCEGWIEGRTSAAREYEGIGLADIMRFNADDEIASLRVYLDYSGILSELPEDVPDFRA